MDYNTIESMNRCRFCDPDSTLDECLADGRYISMVADNIFGDLRIVGKADYTCVYYPRFCPECGRQLREYSRLSKN